MSKKILQNILYIGIQCDINYIYRVYTMKCLYHEKNVWIQKTICLVSSLLYHDVI